jgi:hypothetical protein
MMGGSMKRCGILWLGLSLVAGCSGGKRGPDIEAGPRDGAPTEDGSAAPEAGAADGPSLPGACERNEPARTPETVAPGQGPASLGSSDSDDNGILDRDEWGALAFTPLDTDHDGTPDYQDRDDDGDGLLDLYDPQRASAAMIPVSGGGVVGVQAVFSEVEGVRISAAARAGDLLVVQGAGLTCEAVVLLASADGVPANLAPLAASEGQLRVVIPEGTFDRLAVAVGGHLSGWEALRVQPRGTPLLADTGAAVFAPGATATLKGVSLREATAVLFGTATAAPTAATDTSITFTVPASAPDRAVRVRAPSGESNAQPFAVRKPATLTFEPAATAIGPFEVVAGQETVAVEPNIGHPISISASAPELLAVQAPQAPSPSRMAGLVLALPSDTAVTVNAISTATALALRAAAIGQRLAPASWAEARAQVAALPEVVALANALTDPDAFARALAAAEALIDKGLAEQILAPRASARLLQQELHEPTIEPAMNADVFLAAYGTEGNVKVENDTSLFLSAEIVDSETRRAMVQHAFNAYDPRLIEPQGFLGFDGVLSAKEVEFKAPGFRNAKVRFLAAGLRFPQPTMPHEEAAQMQLFLRTAMDKMFAPLVKECLDLALPEKPAIKLLLAHGYPVVVEAYQAFKSGDLPNALSALLTFLKREVEEQGPFFKGLVAALFQEYTEGLVAKLSATAAKKLVPGIDGFFKVLTLISVAKAFADVLDTPGLLEFDVAFKMAVSAVSPPQIERIRLEYDFEVQGFFMYPRTAGGEFQIPSVIVDDKNPGGAGRIELTHTSSGFFIGSNGRLIKFTLPAAYAARAAGPLEVSVKLGDEVARAPVDVTVTSRFLIEGIAPASGAPGEMITLTGKGFSMMPTTTKVFFTEQDADPLNAEDAPATFTRISDTEITATVPEFKGTAARWLVSVQKGVVGNEERTNGVLFTRTGLDHSGIWRIFYYQDVTKPCQGGFAPSEHMLYPNGLVSGEGWNRGACTDAGGTSYASANGSWSVNGNVLTVDFCAGSESFQATYDPTTQRWLGEHPATEHTSARPFCVFRLYPFMRGCVAPSACLKVTYDLSTTTMDNLKCGFYCTPGVGGCDQRSWEKSVTPVCM